MAKYGMAIDLEKCVGCGACALACKTENNTEYQKNGRKYNWADFLAGTNGTFESGDVDFHVRPVLCNHCTDAPCVAACPVNPKAMYKTETGITMHNDERCIGCQLCVDACPYSDRDVDEAEKQYSVISYNSDNVQSFYDDETAIITDGTSTPADVVTAAGIVPPDKNEYTHDDYNAVRPSNVVEKCILCEHRLLNSENPYCVDSCPAHARIFGDLDDSSSEISQAIANGYNQLKNNSGELLQSWETGTRPNVYYIGKFGQGTKVEELASIVEKLKVYPNPVRTNTTLEFNLESPSLVNIAVYDVSGRKVLDVVNNERKLMGLHKRNVNVSTLKNGTYIIRLQANNKALSANIVVTK